MTRPLLSVQGIRKRFGGLPVLCGICLEIEAGAIKCIIGPNGCGKSTLFNILCGVLRADSGSFAIDGVAATALPAHRIARLGLLRKFQVPGVLPDLSVIENLDLALLGRHGGGVWATLRARPTDDRAHLLDGFGLLAHRFVRAGQLPHGLQQRLELLLLVARGPRLLLLDEPTAGMTARETADTVTLIRNLAAQRGIAVLVIEHDMQFVRGLDCPLVVLLKGAVQREGSYASVRADPQVRRAYLGDCLGDAAAPEALPA